MLTQTAAVSAEADLTDLRSFAGLWLPAGVVLIVIAGTVGVTLWVAGRFADIPAAKSSAITVIGQTLFGAAIVGSISSAIIWGSNLGTTSLMPPEARPQAVEVTKKPARSTCDNTQKADLKSSDRRQVLASFVSDQDAEKYDQKHAIRVEWTPQGPDCTSNNRTTDPCKKVTVTTQELLPGERKPVSTPEEVNPRNGNECAG